MQSNGNQQCEVWGGPKTNNWSSVEQAKRHRGPFTQIPFDRQGRLLGDGADVSRNGEMLPVPTGRTLERIQKQFPGTFHDVGPPEVVHARSVF